MMSDTTCQNDMRAHETKNSSLEITASKNRGKRHANRFWIHNYYTSLHGSFIFNPIWALKVGLCKCITWMYHAMATPAMSWWILKLRYSLVRASPEIRRPIVFDGNPKDACPPKWKSNFNVHHCSYGKIALMPNISKTVTDITMGSTEVEYETKHELSIGSMTFDLGWPWTVLDLGHRTCTSNISNAMRNTMLDTTEVIYKTTNWLPIGTMTFDPRWHWTVLDLGHRTFASNKLISNALRDTMLDTREIR